MPKIKPFYGIRPNPDYAGEVVLDVENLSLQKAKIIRQENPYSYVNMLVPQLDNLFLRGSKSELAFKKINENFEDFIDKGILVRDAKPALYIYRISGRDGNQTGIWTVTSVDDYLTNKIKKHELTRPEREAVLIDYLQQTGIDANPVLITYSAVAEIEDIIARVCREVPDLAFNKQQAFHQLWKIDDINDVRSLVAEFSNLPTAYIADGHHRAAAASLLAVKQRKLIARYNGEEEFNFFTSVYMATDQLKIYPFHRLVKDLNGRSANELIKYLSRYFDVEGRTGIVDPKTLHEFGMYLDGNWYKLNALPVTYQDGGTVAELDVSILQEYVFSTILDIHDPRTDPRISFSGAILPVEELVKQVDRNEFALLFTLFPTSIGQLIKVADRGEVMPPKSTWFEPKFPAGLLIHKIN